MEKSNELVQQNEIIGQDVKKDCEKKMKQYNRMTKQERKKEIRWYDATVMT